MSSLLCKCPQFNDEGSTVSAQTTNENLRGIQSAPPPNRSSSGSMQRRAALSGAFGSALEWFDFAIYGALSATLFPQLFFSGLGEEGATLASFATFGVGFVARPLGAIVFGYLGDRIGRRPILLTTLIIMGAASVAIGFLPTGQGFAVAAILVLLRFVQGFSLGGEATGAGLVTMEHAPAHRRGFFGSLTTIGSPLSQVIANLTLLVLSTTLSDEAWQSWGWRVPFFAGILLVGMGLYIRLKLEETPAFIAQQAVATDKMNGLAVLRSHPLRVLQLTFGWAGVTLTFYLIAVFGLSYLGKVGGMSTAQTFTILMVGNGVSVFAGLLGGRTSDSIGRKKTLLIGAVGCVVGVAFFFPVANTGVFFASMLVVTLSLSSVQFAFGAQPAFFAEQFPTGVRYSGSALALTFSNLVFAAPAPFVAAALVQSGNTAMVAWLTLGALGLAIFCLATLRDNSNVDLTNYTEPPRHAPARSVVGGA